MSRYACELYSKDRLIDDNCIVGFDEPMETFFFHSGEEDEIGSPLLWLGTSYREFRTIGSLITHFNQANLNIVLSAEDMAELKQDDYSNLIQKLFRLI